MRKNFHDNITDPNMRLGVTPIEALSLDAGCRDRKVKVLAALQHIYMNKSLVEGILEIIESEVNPDGKIAADNGRPGMDYWQILVLASLRLGANLRYDELHDLSHQHRALRVMLGFGDWDMSAEDEELFTWRRISTNISKLSADGIRKISDRIVAEGHTLVPFAKEVVRGDSFVMGTNIHYPIDRRQLGDGIRKLIETCAMIGESYSIAGWRKSRVLLRKNKSHQKALSMSSRSRGSTQRTRQQALYEAYFTFCESILNRALETMEAMIDKLGETAQESTLYADLTYYLSATEYIRQLTVRRIIENEEITNVEKLHSIFEPHTELINRGKFPQPIEFGHRILVIEDAAGFICHSEVMDIGMLDKNVLVTAMTNLQKRLGGSIRSASFDCGFYTSKNEAHLAEIVAKPCLPVKGALRAKAQKETATVEWKNARHYHAGVESAIHALQSGNGLDRCRDRGFAGYDRYAALGVLGRNLCTLGQIVIAQNDPQSSAAYSERKAVNF